MAPSDMTPDEMVTFEEEIVQREDEDRHDGPASEPEIRPDEPGPTSAPVIGVVTPS